MVDVDRRLNAHAHIAGLRRLSARACTPYQGDARRGCSFSFAPLALSVIDRLRKHRVRIAAGLSDDEFCRLEAPFAFSFPPDLKAILQEGLPVGAGFPDWRSAGPKQLRLTLSLPIAGLSYEVARGRFWAQQWGPRPTDIEQAVNVARAALRKVPILIPVYRYCYIPASPNLAGNPVFFVCQKHVFYGGYDLANFFERENFEFLDNKLPVGYPNLDLLRGRDGSLGRGGDWVWERGRSHRFEKLPDSARRHSVGDGRTVFVSRKYEGEDKELAQPDDTTILKCEEQYRDLEAWGRNLDALALRYDRSTSRNNVAHRRSFEVLDIHRQASKLYDRSGSGVANTSCRSMAEPDLSSDHHAEDYRCRSTKSSSLAKTVRRTEFWSDLAEKRQNLSEDGSFDHLFLCAEVDMDLEKASLGWKDESKRAAAPYWLEKCLEEMAKVLRNGGWTEEDVSEMMKVVSPPQTESNWCLDGQSMLEGLVVYVNLLSDALRRAGWSAQDVADALDIDICLPDQKRRPSTIPPNVAAKIAKLAQSIAQA